MPVIALQNGDAENLGFLLVAGDAPLAAGQTRDCILTGVPRNSALLEDPLSVVIQENKNTEFPIAVHGDGGGVELRVLIGEGVALLLRLAANGAGEWVVQDAQKLAPGRCLLAAKKAG